MFFLQNSFGDFKSSSLTLYLVLEILEQIFGMFKFSIGVSLNVSVEEERLEVGQSLCLHMIFVGEFGCAGIILYFRINSMISHLISNLFYTTWCYD